MAQRTADATEEQWRLLLDLIKDDKELLTGEFIAPFGAVRVPQKWREIAQVLEPNLEPEQVAKAGERWKTAWTNLKSRAKHAYSNRARYMRGTGGGPAPEAAGLGLRDTYVKVLELIGTTVAIGTAAPDPLQLQLNAFRCREQFAEQQAVQVEPPRITIQKTPTVNKETKQLFTPHSSLSFGALPKRQLKCLNDIDEIQTVEPQILGPDLDDPASGVAGIPNAVAVPYPAVKVEPKTEVEDDGTDEVEPPLITIEDTPDKFLLDKNKKLHTPPSGCGAIPKRRLKYYEDIDEIETVEQPQILGPEQLLAKAIAENRAMRSRLVKKLISLSLQ